MSAPSELHEHRVHLLAGLADLAGFTIEVAVYANLRPDVCRLHRRARSILIADAKSTESPGDRATRRRLARYAEATRLWTDAGLHVAFGVCHGTDDRGEWSEVLVTSLAMARQRPALETHLELDFGTAVSMIMIDMHSSDDRSRSDPSALAGVTAYALPPVRP